MHLNKEKKNKVHKKYLLAPLFKWFHIFIHSCIHGFFKFCFINALPCLWSGRLSSINVGLWNTQGKQQQWQQRISKKKTNSTICWADTKPKCSLAWRLWLVLKQRRHICSPIKLLAFVYNCYALSGISFTSLYWFCFNFEFIVLFSNVFMLCVVDQSTWKISVSNCLQCFVIIKMKIYYISNSFCFCFYSFIIS